MIKFTKTKHLIVALLFVIPFSVFASGEKETSGKSEAVSSNFNETGYPIVNEKVTFKIASKKRHDVAPFEDMKFWKDMESKTNINIEWNITPDDVWPEKKSLMFASGDLPDAIYGPWTLTVSDVLSYADQGLLLPLNDLIEKYAPNVQALFDKRPSIKKSITAPDGNIYTLPSIRERGNFANLVMFINKKWLNELGLKTPETMEELKEVLTAFKTQDPNGNGVADEIPLTFNGLKWPGVYPIFSAFGVSLTGGSNGSGWAAIDPKNSKKIVWAAATDEFKKGMEYLSDLYKNGLIDMEVFTQSPPVKDGKVRAVPAKVGMYFGWSNTYMFGSPDADFELLLPLEGPAGRKYLRWDDVGFQAIDGFAITTACEDPEIMMRWANEQYDPLTSLQATEGIIGMHLKEEAGGKYSNVAKPDGYDSAEAWKMMNAPGVAGLPVITADTFQLIIPNTDTQEKWDQAELYKPFQTGQPQLPKMMYTIEENDVLLEYETELVEYTKEMYASWMINGGVEEQFDEFTARLESMGLRKVLDVYQAAFDRFNK